MLSNESIIARTLAAVSGNQSEAARRLALSRSSFIDRLKKYGFSGGRFWTRRRSLSAWLCAG